MADNYLEKKMEEHRARMAAHSSAHRVTRTTPQPIEFPQRRILVTVPDPETEREIVATLRGAGHKVAFINPSGTALAQTTGARCYPFPATRKAEVLADIDKHWGGLDITVTASPSGGITVENHADNFTATLPSAPPADLAPAILLLTHPSAKLIIH